MSLRGKLTRMPYEMANNDRFHISYEDFIAIAEEMSRRGKLFSFRATGSSMYPFIKKEDTVTIDPDLGSLSVGDVVLVKTGTGKLLLHRIVKKQEKGVVTRGDAATADDGFMPFPDILGRVNEVSGAGYNFHLRKPYKYLIGKGIIFRRSIYNWPFAVTFLKNVANFLG